MSRVPVAAHVAAASLNQTVGDWAGNTRRIRDALDQARRVGARLLVLPEMCIPGYSLGDRLMMRGTLERSWAALESLAPHTHGMVAMMGLPLRHRDVLYNVVAVVADGQLIGIVPKENLATGDVQYENRWFSGWVHGHVESHTTPSGDEVPFGSLLFDAPGIGRFGVEICEDGWKGIRPGSIAALAGAHIVVNPSASWFTLGKHKVRRAMVEQISREDHVVYLYTSLLGCDATRLVFDGSVFVAQDGRILEEGDRFVLEREMVFVHRIVDLAGLERVRLEEGSWRQQVEGLQRGDHGKAPQLVRIAGGFHTVDPAPAEGAYWLDGTVSGSPDPSLDWLHRRGLVPRAPTERDLPHLELELALAVALSQYRSKCGIPGFALALSGGRDSAMCAVLIARAYHYANPDLPQEAVRDLVKNGLVTAYMATANSGQATHDAAQHLAAELGATFFDAEIQRAVDTHIDICKELTGVELSWTEPTHDIPLQNVQARLRGSLIWMVANLRQLLLVSTSNKSEAAVGYATMDGDTSGGISPIADVPKSLVTLWLHWAAGFHGLHSLEAVTGIPATAELRPPERAQTDEDDLMPFDILDRLMFQFVQRGQEPLEMFRTLWPSLGDRYDSPKGLAAHIDKFIKLVCRAQWKRERFAISFRVTAFDLDPKTGFRFPPVQEPFTQELEALHAFVDGLEA